MENNKMRAIWAEVGQEPRIYELSIDGDQQQEELCDLLGGNFGATEFFDIGQGVSLFILTNDLSVPLGLKPNRRFPGKDRDTIIFGNAVFIAAYNDRAGEEKSGTLDMPERICQMFIEQITKNFAACQGDEKPRSEDEIYYDNLGEENEQAYKWLEIEKPAELGRLIEAGRVRFYQPPQGQEIMLAGGRYFRKNLIHTDKTPLH